jgi:hypothetical protein
LTDDLPWGEKKEITLASAPLRDLFLSAAASAVYSLQEKEEKGLGCQTIVGLLLIAIYMSSHQQLHTILLTVKDDQTLLERIKTDLPGVCWETSTKLFTKFWGGSKGRFVPSGFDFKMTFADNMSRFELVVAELKELLKLVNSCVNGLLA